MRSVAARGVNFLRRVKPRALVPLIVAVRALLGRSRPALRADAEAQMRWVVGDDQPDEVVERLAAAYIRRMIWRGEARWHPELVTRQPVSGLEHLRRLREAGTAYVISFAHHGDYEGISPSLAWAGFPTCAVVTDEMFAPTMPVWMRQQKRTVEQPGVTLLSVASGSAGIKEVIAGGRPVALGTDILGNTPVRFLGHDVSMASGAARIARDCDVPVVVVTGHPHRDNPRGGARLTVSEPLHPCEHDSVESLLAVMVELHEAAILAWPEAAEYPMRRFDRSLMIGARGGRHEPPSAKPDPTDPAGYSTAEPDQTGPQD